MAFYDSNSTQHSDGSDSIATSSNSKKIYKTIISYEILSSEPIESMSLGDIHEECCNGSMSGMFLDNVVTNEILKGQDSIDAIKAQRTDPEFFFW